MTRHDVATTREIDAEVFDEEVQWLRTFGLSDDKIAVRLGMTPATFERRLQRTSERSVHKEFAL